MSKRGEQAERDEEAPHKTLKEWRAARFLTQAELAEEVGVTFYTISNWELGIKQPRVKNLRALAAALGIEPGQIVLIEGKGRPAAA